MSHAFHRLISHYAFREDWLKKKMVFLAGPRQAGKTFVAQQYLAAHSSPQLYYNWDLPEVAQRFRENPVFFESDVRISMLKRPTLVFDEIHKRTRWKNELKAVYDRSIRDFNLIVTGSARLDLLRQSGESLAGRYFLFRVLPIGLQEYAGQIDFQCRLDGFKDLIHHLSAIKPAPKALTDLLVLGGFPDPLAMGSLDYRRKWSADYQRLLFREDLRDLSRIQEIDRVETLWSLLPERVGSPLSIRSLQEDLSASHEAIRTWLLNLEKLYSIFLLRPFSKKISRAVKKEKKLYLMDWALHKDEAKRFENFVISSLFRSVAVWNDSGQGEFELYFARNALGQEADFLLIRDGKPWILGDAKLSGKAIDAHLYRMAEQLGGVPVIQVVAEPGIFQAPTPKSLIVSADRLFLAFP